jgi:hypothetical protein
MRCTGSRFGLEGPRNEGLGRGVRIPFLAARHRNSQNADVDDNGGTVVDMVGSPFLTTPPHPEYPAGHGVIQTAGARALEK